ncbi:hypothetical protein BDW22DRAFT_1361323, partial [Trametopsis cervina]
MSGIDVQHPRLSTGFDDCAMRYIAMKHYTPLSDQLCQNPDSIKSMTRQIIQCIHDLRYLANVIHCDISDNNIMYELRDGEDWFVLIDFDLAVRVDEEGKPMGPTPRHRTGMLPFMAVDVIEDMHLVAIEADYKPIVHCVRHDFESLFWVCLWFGIKTLDPNIPNSKKEEEARCRYLAKWEIGDHDIIHATKLKVFTQVNSLDYVPLSDYFEHLRPWFGAFLSCFESGYDAVRNYNKPATRRKFGRSESRFPFKSTETWFECVTRKKMLEAFDNLKLQEVASSSSSESSPESSPESESSLSDVSSITSD